MVMVKSRSKRGNHLNMIKTPKRRRTTKNKNQLKTLIKLNKLFNYRSFNKRLTKKDDKSLNKPNLSRLGDLRLTCRTRLLKFACTQRIKLNASKTIVFMRTAMMRLIKSKPFNYRSFNNRLTKKDDKSLNKPNLSRLGN